MRDGESAQSPTFLDSTVFSPLTVRTDPGFWGWPGWSHLGYAWCLSGINALWFGLIFGGCEIITAHRSLRIPVDLPLERGIPLVPQMLLFYMSIYLLFLAGPFILRTRRRFRELILTHAVVILVGGICFLLVPAQLAFTPPKEQDLGSWSALFHFADWLNLDYNLLPSLHVGLSVACIAAYSGQARLFGKILLWTLAISIAASTVLTHQHHILDAVTGAALAIAAYFKICAKRSSIEAVDANLPTNMEAKIFMRPEK